MIKPRAVIDGLQGRWSLVILSVAFLWPSCLRGAPGKPEANDPTLQTDANWIDDRWQKMEIGQFLCAAIETPRQKTFKGIAIKVGEKAEGAVCFDTDLMRYSAGWIGGFLELSPRRYGLIDAPKPKGEIQFTSASVPAWDHDASYRDPRPQPYGPLPHDWAQFHGLYLHGLRVVLAYSAGQAEILESPWLESAQGLTAFSRTLEIQAMSNSASARVCDLPGVAAQLHSVEGTPMILLNEGETVTAVALVGAGSELQIGGKSVAQVRIAPSPKATRVKILVWHGDQRDLPKFAALVKTSEAPLSLKPLTLGGPPRWPEPVVTRGIASREKGPLVIDTLTVPYENPWHALMFTSGHDFFENGDAAVCTAHGDVWRVSGLDQKLERLTWKRLATGLHQPLGLKIVNNRVYVIGRDQITLLHDLNGDGEADFYQNFNNDCISAGTGHGFATCLETDAEGNFYFLKCAEPTPHGGSLLRVSKDGSRLEVIASGFRNPNGMSIGPGGVITVADQQGEWVPETRLDVIRPRGFYGFVPMHKGTAKPTTYDGPLCWIARSVDNSAGGEAWVPQQAWGPMSGQMIHLSYGRCTMMMVLRDERNADAQGMTVPLPGRFLSGVMRARFHPQDGHLYVTGLRGWQTAALRDGCFQRVRYTGAPAYLPVAFGIQTNGIRLTFSQPLEPGFAESVDSYGIQQWNYRWSEKYGSPDLSLAHPGKEGRDDVVVKSARLAQDGRSVFLEIPGLRAVMEMEIKYNLNAVDGKTMRGAAYATINRIDPSN